jgi:hypothetical protein
VVVAEFWGILAAIITVGASVGIGLATLILRGQQHTDAHIDAMGGRIDAMGGRLSEVEKGLARVEGFLAGAGYAIRREGTSAPD